MPLTRTQTMSDAASPPDIFADNPARHAELDEWVNDNMEFFYPGGPQDDRSYTYLLTLIVLRSDDNLDGAYSQPAGATKRLQEDSSPKDQLRDAWKSQSYREIRNRKYYPRSSSATLTPIIEGLWSSNTRKRMQGILLDCRTSTLLNNHVACPSGPMQLPSR